METSIIQKKPNFWQKIKKELRVIKDDFASFSLTIKILIFILACVAVFISFFKFETGTFGFKGHNTFQDVCQVLNGIGTIAGVITVALVTKKKISTFYWSYIYIPIYALFCASQDLWAVFQVQMFFFLPCSIAGLFIWKKSMNSAAKEVETTPFKWSETLLFVGFFIAVAFAAFYEFHWIKNLSGAADRDYSKPENFRQGIFDAVTSCLLMTGQIVQLRRKNFTMITWLIADIGMLLTAILPAALWNKPWDYNVLIMTSIFVILASYGILRWNIIPFVTKLRQRKFKKVIVAEKSLQV